MIKDAYQSLTIHALHYYYINIFIIYIIDIINIIIFYISHISINLIQDYYYNPIKKFYR